MTCGVDAGGSSSCTLGVPAGGASLIVRVAVKELNVNRHFGNV